MPTSQHELSFMDLASSTGTERGWIFCWYTIHWLGLWTEFYWNVCPDAENVRFFFSISLCLLPHDLIWQHAHIREGANPWLGSECHNQLVALLHRRKLISTLGIQFITRDVTPAPFWANNKKWRRWLKKITEEDNWRRTLSCMQLFQC
jgi:hypothetical protein